MEPLEGFEPPKSFRPSPYKSVALTGLSYSGMEVGKGFKPLGPYGPSAFKADAIGHSANLP